MVTKTKKGKSKSQSLSQKAPSSKAKVASAKQSQEQIDSSQKFKKYIVDAPKVVTPDAPVEDKRPHPRIIRSAFNRAIFWGCAYISIFFIVFFAFPTLIPLNWSILSILPVVYLFPLSLFALIPQLGFSGYPLIFSALFVNTVAIIVSVFYYLHRPKRK
jgi:hypothetical protein